MRKLVPRRTFLQSAGAAAALPMLPGRSLFGATADDDVLLRRVADGILRRPQAPARP